MGESSGISVSMTYRNSRHTEAGTPPPRPPRPGLSAWNSARRRYSSA
jgi:hypothetical protein